MEPIYGEKREAAGFVPYRKCGADFEFFLQRRSKDARKNPDMLGVFGGGLEENETPEQALVREIREELNYTPANPIYFSKYEHATNIIYLFIEEVSHNFDSSVTVCEGQYGAFFSAAQLRRLPDLTRTARVAVEQVAEYLARKTAN